MSDQPEKLRDKRNSVILKVLVRSARAPAGVERRVRNLSASGACIDHAGDLSAGEVVTLMLGQTGETAAHIAWATERLAGVRFERDIDFEAAKKQRTAAPSLKSGWMADMNHAYRKSG